MEPYALLSEKEIEQLRMERLHWLECDHFRACLMLEENPKDVASITTLGNIENAIRHHRDVLGLDSKEVPPDSTVDD